jgi:hypothetical protein
LPIVLLGSVFDNSLGRWIYDWTVYHRGVSTPMADVAGDLWLLLIKASGQYSSKCSMSYIRRLKRGLADGTRVRSGLAGEGWRWVVVVAVAVVVLGAW